MGSHASAARPGSARRRQPAHEFGDDVTVALNAFRRIVRALRISGHDAERRVGLTGAQLFALQQLGRFPGSSVNELAARTFTHQSSVSVVVARLVERRLVAKIAARDDRRRLRLALTDAGRALARRSPEPAQDRLIAGLAALSEADRRTLAASLHAVAETMAADLRPPMFFEEHEARVPRPARRSAAARRALSGRARRV
jgi:DNA-binding MarR family transcriptional regulator